MERSEILTAMGELKLYGMKAAFDEITAIFFAAEVYLPSNA